MLLKDILLKRKRDKKHAIHFRNTSITYEDLEAEVLHNSSLIEKTKLYSNHIGIYLPNSIDFVTAYFTIAYLDRTIVPIGVFSKEPEIKGTVRYCELNMIITNSQYIGKLEDYLKDFDNCIMLYDITCKQFKKIGQGKENFHTGSILPVDENSTALLLHTSGTTSSPKRVMLSHKNLITNATSIISSLELSKDDKTLIALPMTLASANTSQLLTHLYLGASIVIMEGFFMPNIFYKLVQAEKVTNFTGVPVMLSEIMSFRNRCSYDIRSLRKVCFGGGSTPVNQIKQLLETYPDIDFIHMYGQTEASTRITHLLAEDAARKIGSVGRPIPGIKVRIVDQYGKDVEVESTGELIAMGDNIMKGYYKREDETAKVLKDGWLYTGDLARQDEEGYLYITGRKKNVIISGGMNIYPEEIEEILLGHPSVKEARVDADKHELMGEVPVASIVLNKEAVHTSVDEIMHYCFKNLAKYKLPDRIIFVESLPRTVTGKIIRYINSNDYI